jgi:predicted NACHT family NTPase/tRNA A-37 threonylcarbamoyl transferase component Bud32
MKLLTEQKGTSLSNQEERILEGHTDVIRSIAFSPDGSLLASGSDDNTIRIWRVENGSLYHTLEGHTRWIRSVAFSPDGSRIASGSDDNTVRLWLVEDGLPLQSLTEHQKPVFSVAFSSDGSLLASGSFDKRVLIWRVDDWTLQKTLKGHTVGIRSVAFSPDGSLLASGSDDKTIRILRLEDETLIQILKGHTRWIRSIAFSPDGSLLASGSDDNTIRLWRVEDGELLRTFKDHQNPVLSVAFSPDGSLLVSGSFDKSVHLWRLEDGSLHGSLKGHTEDVNSVAFSPDGSLLATGSRDKTVRTWQIVESETLTKVKASMETQDFEEAERLLKDLQQDPNFRFDALTLLSEVMEKKGDIDLALPFLEEALSDKDFNEQHDSLYTRLKDLSIKVEEPERGLEIFKNLFEKAVPNMKNKHHLLSLGELYEITGETEKARDIFKKLVLGFPDFSEAATFYRNLKKTTSSKPVTPSPGIEATVVEDSSQLTAATQQRYQLIKELGRGGMGVVYKARDSILDRTVALKIMRKEICLRKRDKERFLTEARISARLKHPNIVTLHDVTEENGQIYLVFEYVEGKNLDGILDEMERIPVIQAISITLSLCDALEYAHGEGVIHRDMKPSNVILENERIPRILDFGIAKVAQDALQSMTGEMSGTPAYMAPEQHLGESTSPRGDIYSLGVTLYEMVTGELPFRGGDVLAQKREEVYKLPSELVDGLPPEIDTIMKTCLQSDRAKRFPSMGEVRDALRAIAKKE